MLDDVRKARRAETAYDPETGLPRLPEGEPPHPEGIPGLPPYSIVEFSQVEDDLLAEEESNAPISEESQSKNVYASEPVFHRIKKDPLDQKIDDFLKDL